MMSIEKMKKEEREGEIKGKERKALFLMDLLILEVPS